MLKRIIKRQDNFGFPIRLEFDNSDEGIYTTTAGGISSTILNAFLVFLLVQYFTQMITYDNDNITSNETSAVFENIGIVNLMEFDNIPFIRFRYKGHFLKEKDYHTMR